MKKKKVNSGAMLELWRPPQGAGDPLGCLATTYTFAPGLFDEQCLARFLEIESEPNCEDLAFLLERETRLGGSVYAGVLVDHTQAGVEHSLRWDVLPVRIRGGKQHAKISLLSWNRCVRIIVASANLTEPGYRTNHEVAASVDLTPEEANADLLTAATSFMRSLLMLVPGTTPISPEISRATGFLDQVERQVRAWKPVPRRETVRQHLVCTLPSMGAGIAARSSLEEAINLCRGRGGSPYTTWIASPFFDTGESTDRTTASLCKLMARGTKRELTFCLPAIRDDAPTKAPRLAAPKSLLLTPSRYQGRVSVEILPDRDEDGNLRPWHAKMLALSADQYSALMIGSSNFTCAGMGVANYRNAEANLLTVVDYVEYALETGRLKAIWPDMAQVEDPDSAEWLGARADNEEEQAKELPLPAGFLSAIYRAGDKRQIILRLEPAQLPEEWHIFSSGHDAQPILSSSGWKEQGCPPNVELPWIPVLPPEKLLVQWTDHEAFMPLNVEDSRQLPPPEQLEHMSADDMLWILAASDPSSAFRAWVKSQQPSDPSDDGLDSATPIDLDPLRRYSLQDTFLHRIRRRARVLAKLRLNLERPVWSRQALEWRLKGLVGIEPLADRMVQDFANADGASDETMLALADFLIVLYEVDYKPDDGSLSKLEFDNVFRAFLQDLAGKLQQQITVHRDRVAEDSMHFWERVLERCIK